MKTIPYGEKVREIAEHYGPMHQLAKANEELGEAIAAITRYTLQPTKVNIKAMAEELADVTIMIDQLKILVPELHGEVARAQMKKVDRQLDRIAEESILEAWRKK